ncbi:MAG: protoheme IX farnesyltransferase [Candidatus Omnitrophota bacterium]|jgi:protoheme IX farnesyltransferase
MSKPILNVVSHYLALSKFRLTLTASITTLSGYFAAGGRDLIIALHILFAACLLGAGANTFNQVIEKSHDSQMDRTKGRPIPTGDIKTSSALIFASIISVYGLIHLYITTRVEASLVALILLLIYVFFYTPMKRISPLSVYVGAVSGAMPTAIGWYALNTPWNSYAWSIFSTQFIWQIPHFYVIAWMYREDYSRAGFKMVSENDPNATKMRIPTLFFTFLIGALSVWPFCMGHTGFQYLTLILIANVMLWAGLIQFLKKPARDSAVVYVICSALFIILWTSAIIINAYTK